MKATDYTDFGNWLYFDTERLHEADLLYFYPTMLGGNGSDMVTEICDEMREKAGWIAGKQAAYLRGFTNVFAPLYRQLGDRALAVARDEEKILGVMKASEVREDVYAALELYFKRINQGRPFILAGQEQGSALLSFVLDEYMKNHPEYLDRMIAAYVPGFRFTREYFEKNPQLKAAQGETDTGVIVSWNMEGPEEGTHPGAKQKNAGSDGAAVINPLNWRTDGAPAAASENTGSMVHRPYSNLWSRVPGYADARIDTERGVLISQVRGRDWALYYGNIGINAEKRIRKYLCSRTDIPTESRRSLS